jgi:hypothetical protein
MQGILICGNIYRTRERALFKRKVRRLVAGDICFHLLPCIFFETCAASIHPITQLSRSARHPILRASWRALARLMARPNKSSVKRLNYDKNKSCLIWLI